jgi:CxxC motif-containing protein
VSGGAPSELVCIACPIACRLNVSQSADGTVSVSGNRCPRGELYGKEEVLAPKRIVTAVVPTSSEAFPCAPVRTDAAVPRAHVKELLLSLYGRRVDLPVRRGQVLLVDSRGARVIFTRTLPPDDVSPVGKAGTEAEGQ